MSSKRGRVHASLLPVVVDRQVASSRVAAWWERLSPGESLPTADSFVVEEVAFAVYDVADPSFSLSNEFVAEPASLQISPEVVRIVCVTRTSGLALEWANRSLWRKGAAAGPVTVGVGVPTAAVHAFRADVRDSWRGTIEFLVDRHRCALILRASRSTGDAICASLAAACGMGPSSSWLRPAARPVSLGR